MTRLTCVASQRSLVAAVTMLLATPGLAWAQPAAAPSQPAATPPTVAQPMPGQQTPGQPAPQRPFTGLFRGAPAIPQDTVSLMVSGYGGYDNDRAQAEGSGEALDRAGNGPYSGVDLDLAYTPVQRGRVSFNARGTTSLRYYTRIEDFSAATQTASGGTSIQLSPRVVLQARGGVAYTPYFDYTALPGMEDPVPGTEVPPRIPDNTLTTRRVLTYDGGVDLTHAPSDRTSFSFRYAARSTELLDEGQNSYDHLGSVGFSRRLNRRTAMRVAYVFRNGQNQVGTADRSVRVNDVEFGIDRDWARSPTRRTTFAFSVGPSVVEQFGQRFYRGFGGMSLTHPFGRSWNLRANYRRGVQFIDGTARPFFSDSGTVTLSGLVTRRLDLSMSVGAVLGDLGLEGGATPYDTYSASTRFRYGISRTWALYGESLYNYSTYSDNTGQPGLDRLSLRFGITLYVPLLEERVRGGNR